MTFIPEKDFPDYNLSLTNFKGHHLKTLKKFSTIFPIIDFIIELRDSRAPISTTNFLINKVFKNKEKIVLYTKSDQSDIKINFLKRWNDINNERFLCVNTRSKKDAKKIINHISQKYYQMELPPPLGFKILIIGMPNVGKSTLINTLKTVGCLSTLPEMVSQKKKKVARTGNIPGITKSISEMIKMSNDPKIYAYDTPGVFLPTVSNSKTMINLSLIDCIASKIIDPIIQAKYLLYLFNLQDLNGSFYSEYLDHPTNDLNELLLAIFKKRSSEKLEKFSKSKIAMLWVNEWKKMKLQSRKVIFDIDAILGRDELFLKSFISTEKKRIDDMNLL